MSFEDLCSFSISPLTIGSTTVEIPTADGISTALNNFAISVNLGFSGIKEVIGNIRIDLGNIHDKVDVIYGGLSRVIDAFTIFNLGASLPDLSAQDCDSLVTSEEINNNEENISDGENENEQGDSSAQSQGSGQGGQKTESNAIAA